MAVKGNRRLLTAFCLVVVVLGGCREGPYPAELRELMIGFWEGMDLRLFTIDGQPHIVKLPCCPEGRARRLDRQWAISTTGISSLKEDSSEDGYYGRQVVVMDLSGRVVVRATLPIRATILAIRPDLQGLAYLGSARGAAQFGVYVSSFDGTQSQMVFTSKPSNVVTDYGLEWSPDSQTLAYSNGEDMHLFSPKTGTTSSLGKGHSPKWSSAGELGFAVANSLMVRARSGEMKAFPRGSAILGVKAWSSNGNWVLMTQKEVSFFPEFGFLSWYWLNISTGTEVKLEKFKMTEGDAVVVLPMSWENWIARKTSTP